MTLIDNKEETEYYADVEQARKKLQAYIKEELTEDVGTDVMTTALFEEATALLHAEFGTYDSVCILVDALNTFVHKAPLFDAMIEAQSTPKH